MKGFVTKEDLEAFHWYESRHPINLRREEGLFEKFLRNTGLNQLSRRPSSEEITRMYRKDNYRKELRKQSKVYQKTHEALKPFVGYMIDLINTPSVNIHLNFLEMEDEITESVIVRVPYGR